MKTFKTSPMKKLALAMLINLLGASAFAYVQEGYWTDGWSYYYVNSDYQYCTSDYKPNAMHLSYYQAQELKQMSYQGQCESYDKGVKNFRGNSYYFNGEGAYCQYRYYKNQAPELTSYQANQLFQLNRFDGYCVE